MSKLILARHHESEWNKLGKWTGAVDAHLTQNGFEKSEDMGLLLNDIQIDNAFASMEVRSIETLSCMLNVCKQYQVPTEHSPALNERDYGDYTGKNKWEMEKLLGEEEFKKLRRGWDYPVPNGETLKAVYDRAVPYYKEKVLPLVSEGKNVLVVSHGNTLRALTKYIENISNEVVADLEFSFGSIIIYDIDKEGRMIKKEVRQIESIFNGYERAQIVATIGPSSMDPKIIKSMIEAGMNVARLNFSWSDLKSKVDQISAIRKAAGESGQTIPIIGDLPGPRTQVREGHTYIPEEIPTEHDKEIIKFAIDQGLDYIGLSFVGSKEDVKRCKDFIVSQGGSQGTIAKIERAIAVEKAEEIISEADATMVARGDLGNEVPLEKIPFIQEDIIKKCNYLNKPVIVATQMMLSMTHNPLPTRAEVTDVENAVIQKADAVMLSEETAIGEHPVETVAMMKKIILETEKHIDGKQKINFL